LEDSVRKVTIIEAIKTPEDIAPKACLKFNPKTRPKIAPVKAPVPGRGIAIKTAREKVIPREYIFNLLSLCLANFS
jgi:hypothetical protein